MCLLLGSEVSLLSPAVSCREFQSAAPCSRAEQLSPRLHPRCTGRPRGTAPDPPPTWHLERASWVRAGGGVRVGAAAASWRVRVAAVWRMGERMAVGLLERIRESGVEWHVRLVLS